MPFWCFDSTFDSRYLFYWLRYMLPGKTAYATIKSPIDSSNFSNTIHHIGSVMVSILTSSVVNVGFEPRSSQTKDYKIGVCCFFAKHAEKEQRLVDSESE